MVGGEKGKRQRLDMQRVRFFPDDAEKGLFLFKTEDGAKRFCFPQSVLIADDPQRVRTLEQPKIMDKGRESIEMVRMPVGKD
jgi:hypothetical protein